METFAHSGTLSEGFTMIRAWQFPHVCVHRDCFDSLTVDRGKVVGLADQRWELY